MLDSIQDMEVGKRAYDAEEDDSFYLNALLVGW